MENGFNQGYALLIGVSDQGDPSLTKYQLPQVENDVKALKKVLLDPSLCGYLNENVTVLLGKDATKQNIINEMGNLLTKLSESNEPDVTVLIYFSGHGFLHPTDIEAGFRLIPYDAASPRNPIKFKNSTIADQEWAEIVAEIQPERLLLIMDCCHAGATQAKDGSENESTPPPPPTDEEKKKKEKPTDEKAQPAGSKPIPILPPGSPMRWDKLKGGNARVVLQSCQDHQQSWIKGNMSIFTQHLIEGLMGHGHSGSEDQTTVSVLSLMEYLSQKVPATAKSIGQEQHPFHTYNGGTFPIALLAGGKGLGGQQPPTIEEKIGELPAIQIGNINTANIQGDSNILIQDANNSNISINQGK
ncbi:MAG: caspase family protein [Bacteroidota bacterium]